MSISDWLIWSGPVTYVGVWVVILIMLITFEFSDSAKLALIGYAVLPVGAICQSGLGVVLSCIGL